MVAMPSSVDQTLPRSSLEFAAAARTAAVSFGSFSTKVAARCFRYVSAPAVCIGHAFASIHEPCFHCALNQSIRFGCLGLRVYSVWVELDMVAEGWGPLCKILFCCSSSHSLSPFPFTASGYLHYTVARARNICRKACTDTFVRPAQRLCCLISLHVPRAASSA